MRLYPYRVRKSCHEVFAAIPRSCALVRAQLPDCEYSNKQVSKQTRHSQNVPPCEPLTFVKPQSRSTLSRIRRLIPPAQGLQYFRSRCRKRSQPYSALWQRFKWFGTPFSYVDIIAAFLSRFGSMPTGRSNRGATPVPGACRHFRALLVALDCRFCQNRCQRGRKRGKRYASVAKCGKLPSSANV